MATNSGGPRRGHWPWLVGVPVAVVLLAIAALAIRLLSPISTPPFKTADGGPVPNSIAVAERWLVNGVEQSVIIRGRDRANPVLIWLHGGPGSSETPVLRVLNGSLEDRFTVVYWDQRLAGQTLDPRAPPPTSLTVAQMLSDTEVVVDRVRSRLGKAKVVVVGHSWGTMLGVLYASRHPEKVSAYVGIGQMADKPEAEARSYTYALDQAKRRKDAAGIRALTEIGAPPYAGREIFIQRAWLDKYGGISYADMSMPRLMMIAIRSPEANWRDFWAANHGGLIGTGLLEPQLLATNLDHTYTHFDVPMFIVEGRSDHLTGWELAHEYFERMAAPRKNFVVFERSGHSPQLEEPAAFNAWFLANVRPVAVASGPATDPAPR
jgi:proline iminopeptidase